MIIFKRMIALKVFLSLILFDNSCFATKKNDNDKKIISKNNNIKDGIKDNVKGSFNGNIKGKINGKTKERVKVNIKENVKGNIKENVDSNAKVDASKKTNTKKEDNKKVNENLVKKIEKYLNGINHFYGDFKQTVFLKKPETLRGKFWLSKMGSKKSNMRIDYEPKAGQVIFADLNGLRVYDLKGKSIDEYSSDQTPAFFILQRIINLERDCKVKSFKEFGDNVSITVEINNCIVVFKFLLWNNKDIKYLLGWDVIDIQGNKTKVEFCTNTIKINDKNSTPKFLFSDEKNFKELIKK